MLASIYSTEKRIALPYVIGQKREFLYTQVKKTGAGSRKTH